MAGLQHNRLKAAIKQVDRSRETPPGRHQVPLPETLFQAVQNVRPRRPAIQADDQITLGERASAILRFVG